MRLFTPLVVLLASCFLAAGLVVRGDQQPNFLILLTDDQRLQTLGIYDPNCPIETPNIDRLGLEGIIFTNGFVTSPICVASRASILTGRYEANTGVHQFRTFMAEEVFEGSYNMILEEAGYFTGQLGKYGVSITKAQQNRFGFWDATDGQGPKFRQYNDEKLHDSEWLTVMTSDFLDAVPEGQPFALQLNYKAPHGSSVPAPEDDDLLEDVDFERHPLDNEASRDLVNDFVRNSYLDVCYRREFNRGGDHNPFLRDYFEKIVSVDRSVGKIMEELKERGLHENTVIIFLSDHGVHFGERQLYGKWTPFDASLRVPFIVYDPRPKARKGAIDERIVLNIDIAPTILEMAGIEIPDEVDGLSLIPLIETDGELADDQLTPSWRTHFFFEQFCSPAGAKYIPRNEGVRTLTEKFFRWTDPQSSSEEFYRVATDPHEVDNLIDQSDFAPRVAAARKILDDWRSANPAQYSYDSYGRRSQALAPEIDWTKFQETRPEIYQKIAAEVERMGVTWKQALDDWDVRYAICSRVGYWY